MLSPVQFCSVDVGFNLWVFCVLIVVVFVNKTKRAIVTTFRRLSNVVGGLNVLRLLNCWHQGAGKSKLETTRNLDTVII